MKPSKLLLQMQNEYPDQEIHEVYQDGRSIGLVREGSGEWVFWPRKRRKSTRKDLLWICSNPELETREEAEAALRRYVTRNKGD